MDGWIVTDDAPALRPDWYKSWLIWIRAEYKPGRYIRAKEPDDDGQAFAVWGEIDA